MGARSEFLLLLVADIVVRAVGVIGEQIVDLVCLCRTKINTEGRFCVCTQSGRSTRSVERIDDVNARFSVVYSARYNESNMQSNPGRRII